MRRPLCLLCFCFVMAVMAFSGLFPPSYMSDLPKDGSECRIAGKVRRIENKKNKSVVYLEHVILCDSQHHEDFTSCRVICYFPDQSFSSQLKIGNQICVSGNVRLFEQATNPGQFDAREYYGILGYDYAMSAGNGEITDYGFSVCKQWLYGLKVDLANAYELGLPERYAGVMKAMLLGEKGDLDAEVKELYRENGISHILAISGLHITFLGMGVFRLCGKLRIREKYLPLWICSMVSFLLILGYGEMVGTAASTVRSVIMFSLFLLAGARGRTYDMLTAMAVSAALLLVVNPRQIHNSGFLLSFGAVMGIALVAPTLNKCFFKSRDTEKYLLAVGRKDNMIKRLREHLRSSLSASLGVILFTFPVQLYSFYTFSPYSVVLNLVIVPLLGICMATGVFGGIAGCLFPPLARIVLFPCRVILGFYEVLCVFAGSLPFSNVVLGAPRLWQIAVYYGLLFFVIAADVCGKDPANRTYLKRQWYYPVICVVALVVLCLRPRPVTTCTMLDVGQGDCLVITEKSGCNVMVDGGSSDVSTVGKYRMVPYLQSRGIRRLDYIFVSHSDLDHVSGILELLDCASDDVEIGCLVLTKFAVQDEAYADLVLMAEEKGVRILYVAAGDSFRIGETTWMCMYPAMSETAFGNDQSMVLHMKCVDNSILFTGDLTEEKDTLVSVPDVEVLKVAHHGSRYSSTAEFLSRCKPEVSLISAGRDNSYGHPHKDTLKRLSDAGITVFSTPEQGAITVEFGREVRVRGFLH